MGEEREMKGGKEGERDRREGVRERKIEGGIFFVCLLFISV